MHIVDELVLFFLHLEAVFVDIIWARTNFHEIGHYVAGQRACLHWPKRWAARHDREAFTVDSWHLFARSFLWKAWHRMSSVRDIRTIAPLYEYDRIYLRLQISGKSPKLKAIRPKMMRDQQATVEAEPFVMAEAVSPEIRRWVDQKGIICIICIFICVK